jgi:hypothetical protein
LTDGLLIASSQYGFSSSLSSAIDAIISVSEMPDTFCLTRQFDDQLNHIVLNAIKEHYAAF